MENIRTMESEQSAFVGRQPIYDKNLGIFAYELLYRSGLVNVAGVFDGDEATTRVILNTFVDIGFENIVGDKMAFVNLTENCINGTIPLPLTQKHVILEILEDVRATPELIKILGEYRDNGFKIALDDYVFEDKMKAFLPVVDIVKVDIQAVDNTKLVEGIKYLKLVGKTILAEKIETLKEFEACREMGFDLFQGYFLSKPEVVEGRKLSTGKVVLMQLLSLLQDPEVEFGALEALISKDAALSFKLLRYIRSPAVGVTTQVDSIQRALMILGLDALKQFMTLLIIADVGGSCNELVRVALTRAKMCEQIAVRKGVEKTNSFFVVGLFSALDAMLGISMSNILKSLPLHKRLNEALLERSGDEGKILRCVTDYEKGDWDVLLCEKLSHNAIASSYLDAIKWADDMLAELEKLD
ncbi:MAG: HDOD domain-containing protein [Gammaproteobacteria bacterium]|nr:HDOD domain-containing protein [Gammaproteobacteria bacterium]